MYHIKQSVRVPVPGEVFAVPLRGNLYGLVQLAWVASMPPRLFSFTYLIFSFQFASIKDASTALPHLDLSSPEFAGTSTGDEVADRRWQLIGTKPIASECQQVLCAQMNDFGWWRNSERGYLPMFMEATLGLIEPYLLFKSDLNDLRLGGAGYRDASASLKRFANGNRSHENHCNDERVADQEQIAALASKGDRGEAVREVRHYLLSENEDVPHALAAAGEVQNDDGLIIVTQRLTREQIPTAAEELRAAAQQYGIEYDGWECAVTK